jgi:hypothetical protein
VSLCVVVCTAGPANRRCVDDGETWRRKCSLTEKYVGVLRVSDGQENYIR